MKEFIKNNPVFSYIAVPLLILTFIVLIALVLKPRSVVRDYFSKLYHGTLEAIDFIDCGHKCFGKDKLKTLMKILNRIKFCYEMLESEELYEVEGIINNIDKAAGITRALIAAKSGEGEISDYLINIDNELKEIRKVLYSFSLTRDEEKINGFSPIHNITAQKSKKRAEAYLKSIKK